MGQWADKQPPHASGSSRRRSKIKNDKHWVSDSEFSLIEIGFVCNNSGNMSTNLRDYSSGRMRKVSREFLPKYIAIRGRERQRIIACPMALSDAFMVGIGKECPNGDTLVNLYGVSFRGYAIYIGSGESAYFVMFDNYVAGIPRNCMAEFSLALAEQHNYNVRAADDIRNIDWKNMSNVNDMPVLATAEKLDVSNLFRTCSELPVSKVTSQHHTHYTPQEVLLSIKNIRTLECDTALKITKQTGCHAAAAAGFILWLNSLSDELLRLVAELDCWNANDVVSMSKALKKSVRNAKLLQNNTKTNLLPLFEAEVLLNRGVGEVDWAQERENRTKPDVANIDDATVYTRALNIMQQGKHDRGRFPTTTWEQYWKTRWQFTPTGSIKSQYPEDLADMPDDYRLKNKFVALNTTSKVNFKDLSLIHI